MLTSQSHRKDSETGVGFLYFQGVDHLFLNMANPTTTKKNLISQYHIGGVYV